MNQLQTIAEALPGRAFNTIAANENATWVRADDFIVGVTFATQDGWSAEIDAAYRLLDDEGLENPITKHELWNIVLLVRVASDREDLARRIAQDLRYSRKVPYLDGEPIPRLVGPFLAQSDASGPNAKNPIEEILLRIARPEETPLLVDVLIGKDRRDRQGVEQLLDILGRERNDGE